jgi:hypothetical protein
MTDIEEWGPPAGSGGRDRDEVLPGVVAELVGTGPGRGWPRPGPVVLGGVSLAVVLVVVLTALALAPGGSGTDAGPAPSSPALTGSSGRQVAIVGDSLVLQVRQPLHQAFSGAGWTVTVDGLPGQGLYSDQVQARLDAAAGTAAGVLVVATAINDARGPDPTPVTGAWESYRSELEALLRRFADRCVVVVNARDRVHPLYQPEAAVVINRELAGLADRYANLVIVDWAALSRDLPREWFAPDQLHFYGWPEVPEAPESAGAGAYVAAIVSGVTRCPDP